MAKEMSIRGIGHMFEFYVLPCGIVFIIISHFFKPLFSYRINNEYVRLFIGLAFLLTGLLINFISMKKIMPAFKEEKLVTEGIFRFSRNPTYASVIFFTIPAISLLLDSFLILLCSIISFVLFKLLITREEKFLEEKFGDEYVTYKNKTAQLIPRLFGKIDS